MTFRRGEMFAKRVTWKELAGERKKELEEQVEEVKALRAKFAKVENEKKDVGDGGCKPANSQNNNVLCNKHGEENVCVSGNANTSGRERKRS